MRKFPGQVALPGGKNDPGECDVDCALREAQEEVGLRNATIITVLERLAQPSYEPPMVVTPVVAHIAPSEWLALKPSLEEVDMLFVAPLYRFLLDPTDTQEILFKASNLVLDEIPTTRMKRLPRSRVTLC